MAAPTLSVSFATPGPLTGHIKADISIGNILGHTLLWIVLSIVTLGLAAFFYPYAFAALVINRCQIVDSQGRVSRLHCELSLGGQIWHVLVWAVLSVITFGIAFFFYLFKVWNVVLNHTKVVPL